MSAQTFLYLAPIAGVLALAYAWIKSMQVNKAPTGTEKMTEIAKHIRDGAMAFLSREYRVLAIFVVAVAAVGLGGGRAGRVAVAVVVVAVGQAVALVVDAVGARRLARRGGTADAAATLRERQNPIPANTRHAQEAGTAGGAASRA